MLPPTCQLPGLPVHSSMSAFSRPAVSLGSWTTAGSPRAAGRTRQPWRAGRNKSWARLAAKAMHSSSMTCPDVNVVMEEFLYPPMLEGPEALGSRNCGCPGSRVARSSYHRRWPEAHPTRRGGGRCLENRGSTVDQPEAGRLEDSCPTDGCRLRGEPLPRAHLRPALGLRQAPGGSGSRRLRLGGQHWSQGLTQAVLRPSWLGGRKPSG